MNTAWRRHRAARERADEEVRHQLDVVGPLMGLEEPAPMSEVLLFPDPAKSDDEGDIPIEAEEPDGDIPIEADEPAPAPETPAAAPLEQGLMTTGLVEILPADFPLPILAKFVPNPALRTATDEATRYALSVTVSGAEGLQRADLALTALRSSLKAIDEHFAEPCAIANDLHKRLTGIRGEWQAEGKLAVHTVGRRVYDEQRRLEAIAAEARRKAQEEADRQVREAARREAEAAKKAQAPAPVVQELQRQAETATASPVSTPAIAPPLRGTTTVERWKGRLVDTRGDQDPHPAMAQLSDRQRLAVFTLMRAVLEGKAPLILFELNWGEVDRRANAERATMAIPGLEAYEAGGVRAKSTRAR